MLKTFKKTKLAQKVKKTKIFGSLSRSQGDWRYPLMCLSWALAKVLVPRRNVRVDGVKFSLSCENWVTHFRWYLFKHKEKEVRTYIDSYVNEGDVFFDIGANVGVFSLYAGKRFKDVSIYCFDPEYSNLNILKENVIYNNLMSKIKIYGLAVGDRVGLSSLHLQDTTLGAAAHTESNDYLQTTEEGYPVVWSEGVASVTLDYICEQLHVVPNVMKIDTDGHECKVLSGAKKTLADKRLKSLVIEMPLEAEKEKVCRTLLTGAGFSLAWSERAKTRNEIWTRKNTQSNRMDWCASLCKERAR